MIISVINSTETYWLPIYSLNDKMHRTPLFPVLLLIQLSIYVSTGYVIIRTCSIFLSIKVFHENMNILMAWFLFQWFESILAKLFIIPYQLGLILIDQRAPERTFYSWWTDNQEEMVRVGEGKETLPLYFAGLVLWHYIYSMIFAIVIVGLERVAATFFIQDYESVPRRHIPVILIVLTNLITFPYAYYITNNRIPFLIAYFQCFLNASVCFLGYFALWRVNLILRNRMEKGNDNEKYTLARKFQVEENIRSLKMAKKVVFATVAYLSVSLIVLILLVTRAFQGYEQLSGHLLDNTIFGAAPVISITLLFCSPTWKDSFFSQLPLIKNYRNPRVSFTNFQSIDSKLSESEAHFTQLRNSWV